MSETLSNTMTPDSATGTVVYPSMNSENTTGPPSDADKCLSRVGMIAYAGPVGVSYFLLSPVWSILPAIYAKYFGLELTAIAAVVMYSRLFDGFTDPIVGYLSDRHRMAGGTRKPWVLVGGLLTVAAAWFLFSPAPGISTHYYFFWTMCFFLAFTLMEIPHLTWGAEIATDYKTRSTVYSYRTGFIYLGQAAFLGLPLLPFYSTQEFTPEVLRDAASGGIVIMLLLLVVNHFRAPMGQVSNTQRRETIRTFTRSIIRNKPLRLLMLTYCFCGLGFGMWSGLVFIYMDSYLVLGGKIAYIFLLGNIGGFVAVPMWLKLIHKTSKTTAWLFGMVLYLLTLGACLLLAPATTWWWALALIGTSQIGFSCLYVVVPAILADIADYGQLKFKRNCGATYFALFNLMYKTTLGLGSGLSLAIAGYYGLKPGAATISDEAIWGLQLGFIIVPSLLGIVAAALIFFTPINQCRHRVIQRRLESLAGRYS